MHERNWERKKGAGEGKSERAGSKKPFLHVSFNVDVID